MGLITHDMNTSFFSDLGTTPNVLILVYVTLENEKKVGKEMALHSVLKITLKVSYSKIPVLIFWGKHTKAWLFLEVMIIKE